MKKITFSVVILLACAMLASSQEKPSTYRPEADAKAELKDAILNAKAEKKHVLIQIGGNWCPWCIKFHQFATTEPKVDSIIKADYVNLLLNYSRENKNLDILESFQFPQRFGFPVFVVLDGDGKLLHTQDSGLLELDKGYSVKKVSTFLKNWNVAALDPKNY
jgi:thioredoxin-related protein